MKTELVQTLTTTFEAHAQQTEGGVEYWLARDIQYLLGYDEWRNFNTAISKAKTACEVSGHRVADHFADVGKMVDLGSGSQREVDEQTIAGPILSRWERTKVRVHRSAMNMAEVLETRTAGIGTSRSVGTRIVRRVPPLQGEGGIVGTLSQGVALGCRVVAPLARNAGATQPLAQINVPQSISQPEGTQFVSPGQRPGNSANHKMMRPERATPGNAHAQARGLEQTIADNVAEILEE